MFLIISDCFHLYMLEIIREVFLFLILLEEKILNWKGMASIMKNCTCYLTSTLMLHESL